VAEEKILTKIKRGSQPSMATYRTARVSQDNAKKGKEEGGSKKKTAATAERRTSTGLARSRVRQPLTEEEHLPTRTEKAS